MPDYSKVFTYETEGLSYTVSLYEADGKFYADIEVLDGAMDVNAIYIGDDDFSGDSVSLSGPLNMNGAQLDGEAIQWDDAEKVSDPGLGTEGEDKQSYVSQGDTLTLELDVDSLDAIDVFGIRATSTTTEEGSIKAVSDDPEEPEEPGDEPTFEKVFFGVSAEGEPGKGIYIPGEPIEGYPDSLPEGQEATFENYLNYYENEIDDDAYDIPSIQSIVFYEFNDEGYPEELFSIEAPEGGFANADEVLDAYDAAIEAGALDLYGAEGESLELMAALSLDTDEEPEEESLEEAAAPEEDFELA